MVKSQNSLKDHFDDNNWTEVIVVYNNWRLLSRNTFSIVCTNNFYRILWIITFKYYLSSIFQPQEVGPTQSYSGLFFVFNLQYFKLFFRNKFVAYIISKLVFF